MIGEHSTAPNFRASSVMGLALSEARAAAERGEVPVGAVITTGSVLARAGNRVEELADPTAHAEILVIRAAAAARGEARLTNCDLTVTLEPCAMCAQAIAFARLRRVIFAAYDPKGGGVEHGARIFAQPGCNHRPEVVGGIEETEASTLLKAFFHTRR
jgi:tRNA(adenine34) deaminase